MTNIVTDTQHHSLSLRKGPEKDKKRNLQKIRKEQEMKTKTLAISILLLAIVLTPLAMGAEDPAPRGPRSGGATGGPGSDRGMRGGMGSDRLMQQLDLTEEQQAKIKAIQEESQPQMQEARKALQNATQALQEAIEDGTDDQIIAAAKALGEATGKEALLKAKTGRKVNAVLTPEQQAKLKELRTQMRERMQQRADGAAGGRQGRNGQGGQQGQGRGGQGGPGAPQE
jgi:Spy/CpxP family protein refolding chaperone